MTVYKNIKGDPIETVATDPSNPIEGDIWYNTTTGTLKGLGFRAAAWASGGNLNTGRTGLGGAGSQTAALAFGGTVATPATPGNPFKNESEEYNGTSWSEGNNLVNASYNRAGAGTQTATILMGGASYTNPPASFNLISNTEYYDGTSWSEQNDMNTARYVAAGCGSQTSSLVSGGSAAPGRVANVEEWNGTTWSEVNDLPSSTQQHALSGTQTAALQASGNDGSLTSTCLLYDGTNWTTTTSVTTARSALASGGEGATTSSSIVFGGHITPAPSGYQQTEEFTGSGTETKTVTTST